MTLTVSVSELRNNISLYLERVVKGTRVLIRDEKRDVTVAQITQMSSFDKSMYEKLLREASGTFSSQNHPEWKTKSDVVRWVRKSRLFDQRTF